MVVGGEVSGGGSGWRVIGHLAIGRAGLVIHRAIATVVFKNGEMIGHTRIQARAIALKCGFGKKSDLGKKSHVKLNPPAPIFRRAFRIH